MDLQEKVIKSNLNFWSQQNEISVEKGMLLYENFYDTPQLCYGISKVALSIAKSLNYKPGVLLSWRELKISKSMCENQFQIRHNLVKIVLRHFYYLLKGFFISRKALLNLFEGKCKIGECIYDSILIKYKKKTVSSLLFKERMFVVLQLCYYFYFKEIIKTYPVKAVVIGDNVYRYGLLFELCRVNGITCYTPINLNSLFIRRYINENEFHKSYLDNQKVEELCNGYDYEQAINDYYKKRYQGKIEQHDVLTAYGNKKVSNNNEFVNKYKLDVNKKTVVIMCHVFADAPHVYLDTLYDDYWEWFVGTLSNLIKNKNVNILVKEHPSAHLYKQKGLVKEYLQSINLTHMLVDENESTESILNNADIVVTCGGTIGLEFSFRGKNVVLASYPPFGRLGFTTEFNSRQEYEEFLKDAIKDLRPLSPKQLQIAKKVSYIMFYRQDNSPQELELGGDAILLGKQYNNNILYNNIIEYNKIPLIEQNIYKLLDGFVHSDQNALYNS